MNVKTESILCYSREEIDNCGVANFSIGKVAKQLCIPKGSIYKKFKSKHEIFAAIIIEGLRIRNNSSISILCDDKLSCHEKVLCHHLLGVYKTVINKHDIGTIFLVPNGMLWHGISAQTLAEMQKEFLIYYNFLDKPHLMEITSGLNGNDLYNIKQTLFENERGILLGCLNILIPHGCNSFERIDQRLQSVVADCFGIKTDTIDLDKAKGWVESFLNCPPHWAKMYEF
ncbi:TetR/AcrR family transcriptional regulator [Shewanella sp. D64]|uniref:TetR/AcrR family transcriptional regulator n=1 Tax=unclassified Shewanella TaxID=196818 RepID=UPI0022BA46C0|nr:MULTISPECIES: TetR/AcrR family transcriptional regulator [unclassified Shewanella]MEC4728771.1 TetR/AcrR family transcriptional regulator [Shewanella sp. D64]MEC4740203.1 TetR/AcrR family transcriptional regulator [Shewanella sp. E94]WBJ96267.1 TetR/AcrR family transcriptional regulator [Shewanella sp. MTB7]